MPVTCIAELMKEHVSSSSLGARTLLGTPGLTTRSKDATRSKGRRYYYCYLFFVKSRPTRDESSTGGSEDSAMKRCRSFRAFFQVDLFIGAFLKQESLEKEGLRHIERWSLRRSRNPFTGLVILDNSRGSAAGSQRFQC